MKKPFIDWNNFNETKPLTTNNIYLIAIPSDETVLYDFAEYHKKDDIIEIPRIKSEISTNMSAEERLLHDIMNFKKYTAPKSGFYLKYNNTPDDYNDETNEFKDCQYGFDIFDKDIYWSELPIAPKGFIDENEANDKILIDAKQ